MKRSKKPLTFAGIAATIGALSIAVEGCVYGPPPDETMDGPETDVYGPPPDVPEITDGPEVDVYGPPVEDIED